MIKLIKKTYQKIFGLKQKKTEASYHIFEQNKVHFDKITVVQKTPENKSIGNNEFIAVIYQNKTLWALFRCPCGCGYVISLSLQSIHRPHWSLSRSRAGRPTLYPSVSQRKGCRSHFWIKDGRIIQAKWENWQQRD